MSQEAHPESANPAPPELEQIRQFVNTRDLELDDDELLKKPEDLGEWLAKWGLVEKPPAVKPADLKRARELREALRQLLHANNGEPLTSDEPIEVLNRAAARAKVGLAFGRDGANVVPAAEGVDGGIGRLLALVSEAMANGSWSRLKACGEDSCQWAFYDKSKNRSGRWCTMAECG